MKAMTSLGFKLHLTKRDDPTRSIKSMGLLLELGLARISIIGNKQAKVLARVELWLAQVEARKYRM